MDSKILTTKYSDKLAEEVKDLFLGLSDLENLGLLIALSEHGKMSFVEMKQEFKATKNSDDLMHRLYVLQNANLIKKIFYTKSDGREFSYYTVTDIFERVFCSIYEIFSSPPLKSISQYY